MALTKTQVDKLGDRLRAGAVSDDDLRLLDQYSQSFGDSLDRVVAVLRNQLALTVTARRTKTTRSIQDKLRRESIRLSQMQDISGCRVVVENRIAQNELTTKLFELFPESIVDDRRAKPSHGYRAVHFIVSPRNCPVEIQIRTLGQDFWAQSSEDLSTRIDSTIKYGGGPPDVRRLLDHISDQIEITEKVIHVIMQQGHDTEVAGIYRNVIQQFQNMIQVYVEGRNPRQD